MLFLYGNSNIASAVDSKINAKFINFSSLYEGIPLLGLLPPNNLGAISEYDFDVKYMEYILYDDNNFVKFMTIINELINGNNVFLLINEDDWSIILIESLLKLIQQRYGVNGCYIKDMEDLKYANETSFDPYYGIDNVDQDRARYLELYERHRILNGGTIPMYE